MDLERRAKSLDAARAGDRSWLYALELQNGLIKIGTTEDLQHRLKSYGAFKRLIALCRGGYVEELRLQTLFQKHAVDGERFRPDPRMLDILEKIGIHN